MFSIDSGRVLEQINKFTQEAPALFSAFPIAETIDAFDELPSGAPYTAVPERVAKAWQAIFERYGERCFGYYQSVTMLTLIRNFQARTQTRRYTPRILSRFGKTLHRIIGHMEDMDFVDYNTVNDLLIKDLALCRQKMFPAGARIVEESSGVPRSLAFRGGLNQALRFLRATFMQSGGFTGFYQVHTHLLELDEFNPEGWENMFLWVAEMMEINPHIRGVFCASWLYDPALENISPHLAYMSGGAKEKGAFLFFGDCDPHSGALVKSRTRRRLYAEGKYIPKTYYLVWPRVVALDWLSRQRAKGAAK